MTQWGGFICNGYDDSMCKHFKQRNAIKIDDGCLFYDLAMGTTCRNSMANREAAETMLNVAHEYLDKKQLE